MKRNKFIGITALMPLVLSNFVTMPVHAEVTDFQTIDAGIEETSAECEVIYKSTYEFSEEIPKYPELEVTAYGYEGIYDGKSHGITVDCKTEGATILYSTDAKTYSTKKPVYRDVGTYVTYYKVEKDGYTTVVGSEIVKIKEAEIEFDAADCNVYYDGKNHSIEMDVKTDDCEILYSEDGVNFSSKKPEYKEPGTYVVYYKIMKDNYKTVTGSCTVTIKAKDGAVNNSNSQNNGGNQNNSNNQNNNNQNSNQADGKADASASRVQTGDENHIFFYAVALAASALGLAKSRARKEKRKL